MYLLADGGKAEVINRLSVLERRKDQFVTKFVWGGCALLREVEESRGRGRERERDRGVESPQQSAECFVNSARGLLVNVIWK